MGLGHPPPDDYYEGFVRMGELGILPQELARRLAPSAGARNILIRECEAIDDRIVYESIQHALDDYRAYGREILAYLSRLQTEDEKRTPSWGPLKGPGGPAPMQP